MSQSVQGHYGSQGNGNLVGVMQTDFDPNVKKQLIPQPNDNNKTLITASGGHMRGGSYNVDRGQFQSTQQLNSNSGQPPMTIKQNSSGSKSITDSKKKIGSKQASINSKGNF
jgi:hypothetical protein